MSHGIELSFLIQRLIAFPFQLVSYFVDYFKRFFLINENTNYSEIVRAVDIHDICELSGYSVENHVVQTQDGYILTLHRVYKHQVNQGSPVVYFHHGLVTNSEIFVLGETKSKSLPFVLVDRGYDVWLGNNRGNKYSRKHTRLSCSDNEFWDYSLDEFALYDTPDSINHVLLKTKQKDLIVIGFSQGASQTLGALSLSEKLNDKIKLFIGISPSMTPDWIYNPLIILLTRFPRVLYLIFGHRSMIPGEVILITKLLGPFLRLVVDSLFYFLFHWTIKNISNTQKQLVYPHVFSPSSVKSIVHWLQIIKSHSFQMYDGVRHSFISRLSYTKHKIHKATSFPINTITTKIMLVYGGKDNLVEISSMEKSLVNCEELQLIGIEDYEHMDTLWAKDVDVKVFNPIISEIDKVSDKPNVIGKIENNNITVLKIHPMLNQKGSKITEIIDKFNSELVKESAELSAPSSQGSVFI